MTEERKSHNYMETYQDDLGLTRIRFIKEDENGNRFEIKGGVRRNGKLLNGSTRFIPLPKKSNH